MNDDSLLHNQTQHLSDLDWEPYEECPPITKGVLDDQQLDVSLAKNRGESNESNALLPPFQPDLHINLHYVRVYYCSSQEEPESKTRVVERQKLIQWRGEHLKCRVGFSFESCMPKSNWTIGLVQACDSIALKSTFGMGGYYSWEFQPLKCGFHKMVNDSNGSQWPFYSYRSSMIDITAGKRIKPNFHELKFSDYFYPTMHWSVESGGQKFALTDITRRQGFKIWFVILKRGVKNPTDGLYSRYSQFRPETDEIQVLKSMQWRYNIQLTFDCKQPLGSRCVSCNDVQEEQPQIFDTIDPIPTSAMVPPNCNSCQSLMFYPNNREHPLVLKKPPENTVVPWPDWRLAMTAGSEYDKQMGFEEPVPPPVKYNVYPGDPYLAIQQPSIRVSPLEMPPKRSSLVTRLEA